MPFLRCLGTSAYSILPRTRFGELIPFLRQENWGSGLHESSKVRQLRMTELELVLALKPVISLQDFNFSISQGHRFLVFFFFSFVVNSSLVCLKASKDRLGIRKNESQTFLIKYLLSNCCLKYERDHSNADEDELWRKPEQNRRKMISEQSASQKQRPCLAFHITHVIGKMWTASHLRELN